MEDDLVMNKLPLPKYYDGNQWNTIIRPTRKCIPAYLHDQLPALKHIYIKQKFKQIGKFNCPKLQYFDKMIKNKNHSHSKTLEKKHSNKKNKKQISYNQLKEELQYALIIADSHSNIVDKLLQKAKTCPKQVNASVEKRQKNRRLSLAKQTGKFFGNTVDLVFRQRKKEFIEHQKVEQEPDTSIAYEKINNIKLIGFEL